MKFKNISPPRDWRNLKHHPLSEIVDFGLGIDVQDIAAHMIRNGFDPNERIVLIPNTTGILKILEGRHRHDAALKAGVDPVFCEFDGTLAEAKEFVSKKILRQHLDASQRAMFAAKLAGFKVGDNQHSNGKASTKTGSGSEGPPNGGASVAEAAKQLNVSERAVERGKLVNEKCTQSIQRAVRTGDVTVSDAASIANRSAKDQEKALTNFRLGKGPTLAKCVPKAKPKPKPNKQIIADKVGTELPNNLRDVFADTSLTELIDEMNVWRAGGKFKPWAEKIKRISTAYSFLMVDELCTALQQLGQDVTAVIGMLESGVPFAVAPCCEGKGCKQCRQAGYLPEWRHKEVAK